MEVHLIPVKIHIIGRTYGRIKSESPSVHDLHTVGHDAHPVERRLPVKEDMSPSLICLSTVHQVQASATVSRFPSAAEAAVYQVLSHNLPRRYG